MAGCVTKSVRKSGGKAKKSKKELIKVEKKLILTFRLRSEPQPIRFFYFLCVCPIFFVRQRKKTFVYILFLVGQQLVAIRGGTSPTFSSISRARALSIEPR